MECVRALRSLNDGVRKICGICETKQVEFARKVCSMCKSRNRRIKSKLVNRVTHTLSGAVVGCYYAEVSTTTPCASLEFDAFAEVSRVNVSVVPGCTRIDAKHSLYVICDHNERTTRDSRPAQAFETLGPAFREALLSDLREVLFPLVQTHLRETFRDRRSFTMHSAALLYASSSEHAQIPHLDADADEYQVFVVLRASASSASAYPCTLVHPHETTVDQYEQSVHRAETFVGGGAPRLGWQEISYFRHLLQPRADLLSALRPARSDGAAGWAAGTVAIMKGGVVHCAPAHDTPRVVLFFVATATTASSVYDSDSQVHPWSVLSDTLIPKAVTPETQKALRATHRRVMRDWKLDERSRTNHSYQRDL
eukprot:355651-Prorocentrum_minimum.AAC.1